MKTTQVSARWTGDALNYIGLDTKGNEISMGGDDVSPAQMLLLGLAGCMGMDVVSILQKKRQTVTGVDVTVTAHQPDNYPKPFQIIEINFLVSGPQIDPQAVARSIALSEEKYCIVGQTLQGNVEIRASYSVES